MKEKRLIGLFSMDDFKKMRSDVLFFEKTLDGILSEYKDFFDERFRQKKSIRKYAADHNLNRGSVNYIRNLCICRPSATDRAKRGGDGIV